MTGLFNSKGNQLRRMATYASVVVAATLIIAKLAAYLMTDSVAMLSSLLDSTVDLIASGVTMYGVASALRPPDHDHRFGHGKAEPLAALTQAAFIVGSSVLLAYEALSYFYHPHSIQNQIVGYAVMGGAIVMTLGLVLFQRLVIRQTKSVAIDADRLHYDGDLLINVAVVIAFALYEWTGIVWFDPLFAILIAGYMLFNAFKIARDALNILMDRELSDADRAAIGELVRLRPHVRGMHDLRTRHDSDRVFIELHVELDGRMTVAEAHDVIEDIMAALREKYPRAEIIIHQDPEGIEEPRLDEQIDSVARG